MIEVAIEIFDAVTDCRDVVRRDARDSSDWRDEIRVDDVSVPDVVRPGETDISEM